MLTAFTVLVLAAQSAAGSYHPALLVLDDPQAARSFDYCEAPAATPELVQEIDAALAPENGDVTEYETAAALLVRAGLQIAEASQSTDACRSVFCRR